MNKEIRNLRRMLRQLPVREGECVHFREEYDPMTGKLKYPRKLIVEIPIEYKVNWQALCEKVWFKRKRNGN